MSKNKIISRIDKTIKLIKSKTNKNKNTYHCALYSFFALLSTCYFSRKNNCITTPCCQLMNKSIRFFIVFLQRLKLRMIFFLLSTWNQNCIISLLPLSGFVCLYLLTHRWNYCNASWIINRPVEKSHCCSSPANQSRLDKY
jgi:hypothetical protein